MRFLDGFVVVILVISIFLLVVRANGQFRSIAGGQNSPAVSDRS